MRAAWVSVFVMAVSALPLAAQQPCQNAGAAGQQKDHMAAMHKDRDAMMARMDSVDQVLTQQVAALKAAKGSDRSAKLEAVVLTLATNHLEMRKHMKEMMDGMDGGMGGMGGMGMGMRGGAAPCAQPADTATQHKH